MNPSERERMKFDWNQRQRRRHDWTAVDPQPKGGNVVAPPGQVWVCAACGKTARSRYGFSTDGTAHGGKSNADPGWDESCMMNAVLCFDRAEGGGK